MKLIVGLGNIGPQYAQTRHNIGFMVVDELARRLQANWHTESKFSAAMAETQTEIQSATESVEPIGQKILLAKPHTLMNLSGEAVQKIMQFYKISPADIWAICDDLDTPFGKLRVRGGGSSGGHQGLASLMQHIGPNFVRLRVGISMNDRTREPSEIYVLRPFNSDEQNQLSQIITSATDILEHQLTLAAPNETTFDLIK